MVREGASWVVPSWGQGAQRWSRGQPVSGRDSCESSESWPRGVWTEAFVWKEARSLGPVSARDFCEQAGSWFHLS